MNEAARRKREIESTIGRIAVGIVLASGASNIAKYPYAADCSFC